MDFAFPECGGGEGSAHTTPDGRTIVPPGFYLTSYTQLASNGVAPLPDAYDWDDPRALLQWLALGLVSHQRPVENADAVLPDSFADVCTFFAWRAIRWQEEHDLFNLAPSRHTLADLDKALSDAIERLACWHDEKAAENECKRLYAAYDMLKNLFAHNLVELLKVAHREFNENDSTLDEGLPQAQWPALRQRLGSAMRQWIDLPAADAQVIRAHPSNTSLPVARVVPDSITIRPPAMLPSNMRGQPL